MCILLRSYICIDLRAVRGPSKYKLHAHIRQSTHKSPYLFRDYAEGSAVRPGKGRDRTDAGGYKRSLPFAMSRILGVIGSQSSHWSGRLIRVPDKDKDIDLRAGRNCSTAPAIFEIKTIAACPTRYNFARTKAVESRATGIRSEYARKVERIDQIFAPNVVGNDNDGISGPFQNAYNMYNTFCRGGVIPLVIGAYGETNEDFQDVLKSVLAWRWLGVMRHTIPPFSRLRSRVELILSPYTCIVERLPVPLLEVSPCTRGHDCTLFEARE